MTHLWTLFSHLSVAQQLTLVYSHFREALVLVTAVSGTPSTKIDCHNRHRSGPKLCLLPGNDAFPVFKFMTRAALFS